MDPVAFEAFRRAWFAENGFVAEGRWFDHADGRRTYALVRDGEGIPTVVVHGGLADASVWSLSARHLEGRVVIVDRPGCGLSSPKDYRGVAYREDAAAWMDGLLDALGVEQVDLVGNSMGGFFCLAYALAKPERVRRLVLPGAPAGLDPVLPTTIKAWGLPLVGPTLAWLMQSGNDPDVLPKRVFPLLVAEPDRLPAKLYEVMMNAGKLPGVGTTAWTMVRAVANLGGWRPELLLVDAVKQLTQPTLFLWGELDQFSGPDVGRAIAAGMPDATFESLAGIGHMPQLEAPERVGIATRDFLRGSAYGQTARTSRM